MTIQDLYKHHFSELYQRCDQTTMATMRTYVEPNACMIADAFYEYLLSIQGSEAFLNSENVKTQLRYTMKIWILELFHYRDETALTAYIERQLDIGRVHARIGLPPHLFNCGVRVIRNRLLTLLLEKERDLVSYHKLAMFANMLLDIVTSLMNETYFSDVLTVERQAQSLHMHMMGHDLAMKCEQHRADLFNWHAQIVAQIYASKDDSTQEFLLLYTTDFALWIRHKAALYFFSNDDIDRINTAIDIIDAGLQGLIESHGAAREQNIDPALTAISNQVKHIAWALSALVEQCLSQDSGRDPLTRLFNRRYLAAVMKRETEYCIQNQSSYAVLMMDIDHFKNVNDTHGHGAGDKVLSQVAEMLEHTLRVSDFIFRYGGEEFLVILPDMVMLGAVSIAEKVLHKMREHEFDIGEGKRLHLTASIGIGEYQGHRDHATVITAADQALYQAKGSGRDCVVCAEDLTRTGQNAA